MNGDNYRCEACRRKVARCITCRAARAAYRRDLRARKRDQGICTECPAPADAGTLCSDCQAMNRRHSKASHALARAEGRE